MFDGVTLEPGDDARIGMRTRYKGRGGKEWGYLASIEQYSDGSETWCVVEIGGVGSVDALSNSFELLDGRKKDGSLPPFKAGDRVRYLLDKGGKLDGTIVKPLGMRELCYLIEFDDGQRLALPPQRVTRIESSMDRI